MKQYDNMFRVDAGLLSEPKLFIRYGSHSPHPISPVSRRMQTFHEGGNKVSFESGKGALSKIVRPEDPTVDP